MERMFRNAQMTVCLSFTMVLRACFQFINPLTHVLKKQNTSTHKKNNLLLELVYYFSCDLYIAFLINLCEINDCFFFFSRFSNCLRRIIKPVLRAYSFEAAFVSNPTLFAMRMIKQEKLYFWTNDKTVVGV